MANNSRIEVIGLPEIQRTMHKAAEDIGDLTAENERTGAIIVAAARTRAPKLTGRLAGSIVAQADNSEIVVSTDVIYAGVTEWGWPQRNRPARHFLVPAVYSSQGEWGPLYEVHIDKTLKQVKGA